MTRIGQSDEYVLGDDGIIFLMLNKMNILSLFDGISCGRLALERAGIKIDKYFASEIDKYAIQIAKKNYPDTIHIGSVTNVSYRT